MFPLKPKNKQFIYLDHAAATPLDPRVFVVMKPYLTNQFANPSGLSTQSVSVRKAIDHARQTVADTLSTQPDTIFFTSGGTESTNMAIFGCIKALKHKNIKTGHIITTQIEHNAVLEPIKQLEKEGWVVTYLPVNEQGSINKEQFIDALRKDTVLVSIMYANNEIGTIEPIADIGREILKWRKDHKTAYPYFHTDACQAAPYLDLHVERLHVDLMSLNGSKIYGPKGVGMLYKRRGVEIETLIYGGGQEAGLRSGTENVAGIIGFAKAMELVREKLEIRNKKLGTLRNYFWQKIQKMIPDVVLNGPAIAGSSPSRRGKGEASTRLEVNRLPNNLNITVKNVEAEALLFYLDSYGIIASSGSACTSSSDEGSHVLKACGKSDEDARSSIRFTLGNDTTKKQIDTVMKYLPPIIKALQTITSIV